MRTVILYVYESLSWIMISQEMKPSFNKAKEIARKSNRTC